MKLTDWWRGWRQQRALERRAVPDDLWLDTLRRYSFLRRRPMHELQRLREMTALFLDRKEFSAAGGLELRDDMAVAIAAQACVPVLQLGLDWYDGFVGIVLHPQEVQVERTWTDEDGVVHQFEETLAGEAVHGGPVMLSWQDVQAAGEHPEDGYNVVIHEFVHVIDQRNGVADGHPPQRDLAAARRWEQVMQREFERLCNQLEAGDATYLDPYAAQGLEEFFPVSAEAFFTAPGELRHFHPDLYDLLRDYFGQDPERWAR